MLPKLGPKIADGRTAEVFAWGDDQVLKLYREGWPRRVAEFEYHQALASQQTGYRVPRVGEIIERDGRVGIIYQRVDGHSMVDRIIQQPYRFSGFTRQMTDLHLEMHAKNAQNLEPVTERLAGKIQAVQALDQESKNAILQHLFSLPQDSKLLHGDFHPGNILLTANGPVIIDWIDATLGHPLADVARTAVIGTFGIPPEEVFARLLFKMMVRGYLRRYLRLSPYSHPELESWLLPVAAGRLSEEIPHETVPLLAFVKKRLQQLG
jgi:Ser/Thr protein kinase RdoA (MazF antagonist)